MSVDISGDAGDYTFFSNVGWWYLLEFAKAYRWNPSGSEPPPESADVPWHGRYELPEGQHVSDSDARALGAAVERGLDDPARKEVALKIANAMTGEVHAGGAPPEATIKPFLFDEKGTAHWRIFVKLCRAGGFTIT